MDQELSDAPSLLNTYWTGPWPECHVEVHHEFSAEVSYDVHMKVDLLGSVSTVDTSLEFYGIETMSAQEAETTAEEVADATSGVFIAALAVLQLSYTIAWFAVSFAASLVTFATEGIFWALLGIALAVTALYYATMIRAVIENHILSWIAGFSFLCMAIMSIAAVRGANSAAGSIAKEYGFIGTLGDLFFDRVINGPLGDLFDAAQHRSHWALMVARIIVFIAAIAIASALFLGAFDDM